MTSDQKIHFDMICITWILMIRTQIFDALNTHTNILIKTHI